MVDLNIFLNTIVWIKSNLDLMNLMEYLDRILIICKTSSF